MIVMSVLSVRLDPELEEKLQFLLSKRKINDKSAYIRRLLDKSIANDLLDYLSEEVRKKRLSAWKAAEIAKISLRAMLQELALRNVMTVDEYSLEEDLQFGLGE